MIHPLLAQESSQTTAGTWGALGAIISIVLVQVGKMLGDWRKDKRDLLLETQKSEYLKRIADSNEASLKAQVEVKTTLEIQDRLAFRRHKDLLEALTKSCKQK